MKNSYIFSNNLFRNVLSILFILLLTGCASQIMQSYVGKTIQEAMVDYGPPVNAFDMGDGRRAFQWIKHNSYTTPTYATTQSSATTSGYYNTYQTWINSNTTIYGGQTINSECIYTVFATWSEILKSWKIIGFKKPNFMCE